MKHWYRTLPAKIICFILSIVFLAVSAAGVAAAVFFIGAELYTIPEKYAVDSLQEDMLRSESNNLIWDSVYMTQHKDAELYHDYDYSPDITNVRYRVLDESGKVIGKNSDTNEFDHSYKYVVYTDSEGDISFECEYYYDGNPEAENAKVYTIEMTLEKGLPVRDDYSFFTHLIGLAYSLLYWVYPITLTALALSITCFIILMCASGKRPDDDGIYPGPLHKIPIDLFISILVFGWLLLFFLVWDTWYTGEALCYVLTVILSLLGVNALFGLFMSIAVRIKTRTLLRNTLVWILIKLIWKLFRAIGKGIITLIHYIPFIWRSFLLITANFIFDFILLIVADSDPEVALAWWVMKAFLILPVIVYTVIMLRKLEKGGKAISEGDTSYRINTKGMLFDFKRHGENLNSISEGMGKAVEKQLKSERMKTELITNVSHDIKTPITSIINYAGLIFDEPCDCMNHREYSVVLMKKADSLKRLLNDLVEVSKASTGNMDVELSECDASVLLTQLCGEFEDKCNIESLELITQQPATALLFKADSRRIWRVFENLLNNACKYSLPGSRVYMSVEERMGDVVFIIRNTSKAPLNISADELTARFVRGDSSRSTEGSGLGLSIAKSLTELQGGAMDISIDGDLFKVTLTFPKI